MVLYAIRVLHEDSNTRVEWEVLRMRMTTNYFWKFNFIFQPSIRLSQPAQSNDVPAANFHLWNNLFRFYSITAVLTSSLDWNPFPVKSSFKFWNRWKSEGTKSAEQGGWLMILNQRSASVWLSTPLVWARALPCW